MQIYPFFADNPNHEALKAVLGILPVCPKNTGFVGIEARDKAAVVGALEALARLKFEKPNHQICIRRQDLIDRLLVFESAEEIQDGSR